MIATKHAKANGFSLIELMITSSLMMIVGTGVANIMISNLKMQAKAELRSEADHALRIAGLHGERGKEIPETIGECALEVLSESPASLQQEIEATSTKGKFEAKVERIIPLVTL